MVLLFQRLGRRALLLNLCLISGYSAAAPLQDFAAVYAKVQQYQGQSTLAKQRQDIANLNVQNSRLWQNPSISLEQTGFDRAKEQELSFSIQQPLDIFGQRKLNQQLAKTAQTQLALQQQLWSAQSQLIVKYAWSELLIAAAEQDIYAKQLQVSQANLDSAKKRYQAGSIALVDYERAQIEALNIERLSQQASLQKQVAQRQLSNLWGESEAELTQDFSQLTWPTQSSALVQQAIADGWLEKLYALNIQQSTAEIENIKLKARPQPTLNMGMNRSRSPDNPADTTLVLGVGIPLNIFNRQQYSIPMAKRQQLLQDQQQQFELKQQLLDIANRLHALKALKPQSEAIANQVQLATQVQKRSLQGFQAGKLSLTDVQQASSQLQNLRIEQTQLLRQAWRSALEAEALSIGTSYTAISEADAYSQLNKTALEATQNLINSGAL